MKEHQFVGHEREVDGISPVPPAIRSVRLFRSSDVQGGERGVTVRLLQPDEGFVFTDDMHFCILPDISVETARTSVASGSGSICERPPSVKDRHDWGRNAGALSVSDLNLVTGPAHSRRIQMGVADLEIETDTGDQQVQSADVHPMNPPQDPPEMQSLLGKTLKQYRVSSLLGRGGMGVVYRAHDEKLQRQVAIKLLAPDVIEDPERRKRFLLEARAAARITHPAIAQIYDVDEQDGLIFIAMELVEGSSVRELIQRKGLDLLGAIDVAQQVAGGLAKAHQAGIVHRDIKSANVMVTPDGHAKILDFGLAKLLDPDASTVMGDDYSLLTTVEQTQMGTIKGTPAYMSPEQVKGLPVDTRSDIFSLGAMLFEMVTGQAPFQRGTVLETIHAVVYEEPVPPTIDGVQLPDELRRIIERCLRKNPDDRYANARDLMEELRVARRNTESGYQPAIPWKERIGDTIEQVSKMRPAQMTWLVIAVIALGIALYSLVNDISLGGFALFLVLSAVTYRYVRNQPRRQLEWLIRKCSKVPEVKLITVQKRNLTVVIDRPTGQLYERINKYVNLSNSKLYFSEPVSVAIRHEVEPEEWRRLLGDSGVQFLREASE